jgi:hypothetical protein
MVVPVFLAMGHESNQPACHAVTASTPMAALLATFPRAVGYLLITAAVAPIVFERPGIRMLRKAWSAKNQIENTRRRH